MSDHTRLGTPTQLATFLGSVADALDGEQEDVFAVDGVRDAAEHLRRLLGLRLAEADDNQGGTPMTTTLERQTGRGLVDPDLYDRLVHRVACDQDFDDALADRIVDQTLVFLQACADNPRTALAPSPLVDVGWHTFILHTREYADFCERVAGWFVHHAPSEPGASDGLFVADTVGALKATGLYIDLELWTCAGDCQGRCQKCKKCHQCHGGCHDSP